MKPSAMTVPRNRAMRGRSVKLVPLFVRTKAFQFTPVELVQRREDFVRQRHHHVFDVFRKAFDVNLARRFGRSGPHWQEGHGAASE